jgi:hypothetical protein
MRGAESSEFFQGTAPLEVHIRDPLCASEAEKMLSKLRVVLKVFQFSFSERNLTFYGLGGPE